MSPSAHGAVRIGHRPYAPNLVLAPEGPKVRCSRILLNKGSVTRRTRSEPSGRRIDITGHPVTHRGHSVRERRVRPGGSRDRPRRRAWPDRHHPPGSRPSSAANEARRQRVGARGRWSTAPPPARPDCGDNGSSGAGRRSPSPLLPRVTRCPDTNEPGKTFEPGFRPMFRRVGRRARHVVPHAPAVTCCPPQLAARTCVPAARDTSPLHRTLDATAPSTIPSGRENP